MSIADVIKSIEQGAFKEVQAHEIGDSNGEPIDCSTLKDKPVIKADATTLTEALRSGHEETKTDICNTNLRCELEPTSCRFAVEVTTFEDIVNGQRRFVCGCEKCKYQK